MRDPFTQLDLTQFCLSKIEKQVHCWKQVGDAADARRSQHFITSVDRKNKKLAGVFAAIESERESCISGSGASATRIPHDGYRWWSLRPSPSARGLSPRLYSSLRAVAGRAAAEDGATYIKFFGGEGKFKKN